MPHPGRKSKSPRRKNETQHHGQIDQHNKEDTTTRIVRKSRPKDIFEAIAANDETAVKDFVEIKGIPLTTRNSEKQTAAHVASQNGNLKLLKYLLQKDRSVLNIVDQYDNNVLFWAVQNGFLDVVQYLVDVYELDISQPNKNMFGNCAVHVAAENGQLAILKYLIEERYGDVNIRNAIGEPPIFLAADKTQMHIIKYLVEEKNANVTMTELNDDNILFVCAKRGELTVPKYFLDERRTQFDINYRNIEGRTVTFVAARFDNLDIVKYFVEEKHADINIADEQGKTPLYEAADIGHFEMVKYLVEKGANLELRDKRNNKTVLQTTTDKDIQKYLKKIAIKRTRRSASEILVNNQSESIVEKFLCAEKNCIASHHEFRISNNVIISGLDSLLVFANTYISFIRRSRYERRESTLLMSPLEMLLNKVDPFAVDATNHFLNN